MSEKNHERPPANRTFAISLRGIPRPASPPAPRSAAPLWAFRASPPRGRCPRPPCVHRAALGLLLPRRTLLRVPRFRTSAVALHVGSRTHRPALRLPVSKPAALCRAFAPGHSAPRSAQRKRRPPPPLGAANAFASLSYYDFSSPPSYHSYLPLHFSGIYRAACGASARRSSP